MDIVNKFYNSLQMNIQKVENTETFMKLERKLGENRWYKPMLDYAEVSLNVNRVYLVLGVTLLLLLGLLLLYGVSLITSVLFGFIYPFYKTLLAIQKPNPPVQKKWLMYWLIHAGVNFAETFFFLSWLPGYWMLKCAFLYWCYAPQEINGSDIVYNYMIRPLSLGSSESTDNSEAIEHPHEN